MKRPSSILLLLTLLLFQSAGWLVFWKMEHVAHRSRVHSGEYHAKAYLDTLTLVASDFMAAKVGSDEFQWQGDMFDIRSATVRGDSVCVVAFRDTHETELLSFLARFANGDDPSQHSSGLFQWLLEGIFAVFLAPILPALPFLGKINAPKCAFFYHWHLTNALCPVDTPPPQFVSNGEC